MVLSSDTVARPSAEYDVERLCHGPFHERASDQSLAVASWRMFVSVLAMLLSEPKMVNPF